MFDKLLRKRRGRRIPEMLSIRRRSSSVRARNQRTNDAESVTSKIERYEAGLRRILEKRREQQALINHLKSTGQHIADREWEQLSAYEDVSRIAASALDLDGHEYGAAIKTDSNGSWSASEGKFRMYIRKLIAGDDEK
jgi:hypothetical protein